MGAYVRFARNVLFASSKVNLESGMKRHDGARCATLSSLGGLQAAPGIERIVNDELSFQVGKIIRVH